MHPAVASPKLRAWTGFDGSLGAFLGILWSALPGLTALAATNSLPWHARALVGMEVGPTGAQFAGGQHAPGYAAHFDGL
ncbi:MAG: hypothetical protein ACKO3N_08695 [Verrucomicrobiota bacterium]